MAIAVASSSILVLGSPLLLPATAQAATVTQNFTTPGTNSFQVPAGVTSITFTVYGAAGGGRAGGVGSGAAGGRTTATESVTPLENFQINVGGQGGNGVVEPFGGTSGAAGAGGINGGADLYPEL